MSRGCEQLERVLAAAAGAAGRQAGWREHLAGCADCRAQLEADALLRGALALPPPPAGAGFEARLRARLEQRAAARPAGRRRGGSLRPSGWWALAGYGTAAAAASAVILARLPWESLAPQPMLAVLAGAVALLSPLLLVDRLGVLRPPGQE